MIRNLFRTRRAQGDHGAVLVVVAITMTSLISMAAFAVNLGSISLKRRDLQAVADAMALDLGRDLNGGPTTGYATNATWLVQIATSRTRNGFAVSGTETDGIRDLKVIPGCFVQATYDVDPSCPNADAVKVIATDDVSEFFRFTNGTTSRSAIGRAGDKPIAEISIGSKLASIDAKTPSVLNPVLTRLLGADPANPLNVSLLGYQGVAAANVNLGLLAAQMGFGTVDALLAAPSISVKDLLSASATVLGIGTPAGLTLNGLAAKTSSTYKVKLGDLISVADGGNASAANVAINAFDLLMGSAQLANKSSFIDVPGLTFGIPGLTASTLRVSVIQAPQIAIGPAAIGSSGDWVTQARTAQLDIKLNTTAEVGLLGLTVLNLVVELGAAQGIAKLTAITCAGPNPNLSTVGVEARTFAATATANVTLVGLPIAGTVPSVSLVGGGPTPLTFVGPYPTPPPGQAIGAVGLGLSTSLLGNLSLLGGLIPLSTITSLLSPVTTQIDLLIFDPLFKALGLSVAGADNRVLGVFDCDTGGSPLLVG